MDAGKNILLSFLWKQKSYKICLPNKRLVLLGEKMLYDIMIEEMPQGCIIHAVSTKDKIVISSINDAIELAQSLLEMVKAQIEKRGIE